MSILCKIFGHKMHYRGTDISGESYCERCSHTGPGMQWRRAAPNMPKCRPAREDDCVAIPTKPLMDAASQLFADTDVSPAGTRKSHMIDAMVAKLGDMPSEVRAGNSVMQYSGLQKAADSR